MTPEQSKVMTLREAVAVMMAHLSDDHMADCDTWNADHTIGEEPQPCNCGVEVVRAALAVDAEERREIVAVPIEDARLIRRVFLPSNPNKMRNADPAVVEAARRFIALLAKLEGKPQ